jgi:hypothetical protein
MLGSSTYVLGRLLMFLYVHSLSQPWLDARHLAVPSERPSFAATRVLCGGRDPRFQPQDKRRIRSFRSVLCRTFFQSRYQSSNCKAKARRHGTRDSRARCVCAPYVSLVSRRHGLLFLRDEGLIRAVLARVIRLRLLRVPRRCVPRRSRCRGGESGVPRRTRCRQRCCYCGGWGRIGGAVTRRWRWWRAGSIKGG